MESIISVLLLLTCAYLLAGISVAALLHHRLGRLDPATVGAGWLFRLLITPGMIALWPMLLYAWVRTNSGRAFSARTEAAARMGQLREAHGLLVLVVTVVVALVLAFTLGARPGPATAVELPNLEDKP